MSDLEQIFLELREKFETVTMHVHSCDQDDCAVGPVMVQIDLESEDKIFEVVADGDTWEAMKADLDEFLKELEYSR